MCTTGAECVEKLLDLHDTSNIDLRPTIVLIDMPHDEKLSDSDSYSQNSSPQFTNGGGIYGGGMYGLRLLEKVVYETHSRNLAKLVVAIPVISFPLLQSPSPSESSSTELAQSPYSEYLQQNNSSHPRSTNNRALVRKCLDSGAVDVMASPLHVKTLTTLEVHAYRAHKEALKEHQALLEIKRGRKRSWVGVHEEQPFSYLREAMVSSLMGGICRSGHESDVVIGSVRISVSPEQQAAIADAVGKWHFCAHEFDDDQLLIAASLMFKHAFSMSELEHWRIPTGELQTQTAPCISLHAPCRESPASNSF